VIPTTTHWLNSDPTTDDYVEVLSEQQLHERYPGFRHRSGMVATCEREAGFLRPEVGVAAHLRLAERDGAVIRRPEKVTDWEIARASSC